LLGRFSLKSSAHIPIAPHAAITGLLRSDGTGARPWLFRKS
jgi:hypothetical protein